MFEIIDHELVTTVGSAAEVTGVRWMHPQQGPEGLRHRINHNRPAQLQGQADEVLGLREELLTGRQIPNRR